MASRDTEGRREIQAARKRLAAAKSQSSTAAKALESATGADISAKQMATKIAEDARKLAEMAKKNADAAAKSKEAAKSQYDDSEKEVEEAETFLKEAEKRWVVVDVDSNDGKGLFDVDTDNESHENESRKKKRQKTGVIETIMVEGCGIPGANGTYKRSDGLYSGVPKYFKEGQWEGKDATYEIFHESYLKKWYIGVGGCLLYNAPATTDAFAKVPPENGWKVMGRGGVNTVPKLKWS